MFLSPQSFVRDPEFVKLYKNFIHSAMEQFVEASSGFGPVNTKDQKNVSSETEKNVSKEWSGYRNCVSSQSMVHNYENFKRSDAPERLMEWCGGAWVELSGDALSRARSAFLDRVPMVEIEVEGNVCIFDFYRMLKVEVGSSGLQRSIAWIDLKGNCFFPKFFVDESLLDDEDDDDDDEHSSNNNDANIPKIEIEIKIDNVGINVGNDNNNKDKNKYDVGIDGKRKKLCDEEDTADSSCNSITRDGSRKRPRFERVQKVTWPNSRLVPEEERAFVFVKNLFMNGMKVVDSGVEITAIRQFVRTGPIEKARWAAFHTQMETMQGAVGREGRPKFVFAWHGASKKGVFDILAHGFGVPSDASGSQAHGVGVYLSPARLPHFSDAFAQADDDGEKHLVLCRVVLGNVEKVDVGSQQCYPSSVAFDSGVDNLANPKWYVVWTTNMNTRILPECVVSYKCSDCKQGTKQGDDLMKWMPDGPIPAKLFFSKLGALVPTPKFEQLKAICMTFKAGNMTKDLFIRQLRSIIGNDMLRSALAGIQGSK